MTTRKLNDSNIFKDGAHLTRVKDPSASPIDVGDFLVIGRDETCGITVMDDFVSGRHARIEKKEDGYLLRDLRSRNGTYLNGTRICEAYLANGDRIRCGHTELTFENSSEPLNVGPILTSKNEFWQEQLARIPSIAATDLAVLLTGPSGTGKDILANAIHRMSSRKQGPFVGVNCSALSESLIESELFGHVRGSFTGATHDRQGAFEVARGGTLFLDEIGDLPLSLQPKLLRALENRQIRPVGADKTVETDIRVVAATHQNLRLKVAEGSFRSDLYFRLNVVQIQAPPLALRLEDFDDLFYNFAKLYHVSFSFDAVQRLKQHPWPGNIRELKNVVARAKAYHPNLQVQLEDVERLLDIPVSITPDLSQKANRSFLRDLEYEIIKSSLIANRGNQRKTATELGLPKSTLHDRIRSYGIDVTALLKGAPA